MVQGKLSFDRVKGMTKLTLTTRMRTVAGAGGTKKHPQLNLTSKCNQQMMSLITHHMLDEVSRYKRFYFKCINDFSGESRSFIQNAVSNLLYIRYSKSVLT